MDKELIEKAIEMALGVRELAYAPYSNFKVGAAIVTKDGKIFTGCNVENASYGLTICAERSAIFKAVSEGKRDFSSLIVVTDTEEPAAPCGACRQVIREFSKDLEIIMVNLKGKRVIKSLEELLPESFGPEDLLMNH
ncbi:MAG TPA: cytidine deaminase [Candidatus Atribacteria bacterium]|nr:cytidine deaminase [Candidatus Atribacteria bacterium]